MASSPDPRIPWYTPVGAVTVEKHTPDKPHQGKVLAAIQAHADDIPLFCAGLVAKLIAEGYTAYLIQTTNDEKCGPGTMGETILQNEREVEVLAGELGFKQVIHLGYRNHFLDEAAPTELRARLVFLIRALKIDTITTFSPWGPLGGKPGSLHHWPSGRSGALDGPAWGKDYPEQLACGLQPHSVKDLYYWTCRPGPALQHGRRYSSSSRRKGRRHECQQGPRAGGVPTAAASRNGWRTKASTCPPWAAATRRPTASTSASLACKSTSASVHPTAWTTPRRSTTCRPAAPLPAR